MVAKSELGPLTNAWRKETWLDKKRALNDAVWLEAAILDHPEAEKVYLAPFPTHHGIVYEVLPGDIVEAVGTGRKVEHLKKPTRSAACT